MADYTPFPLSPWYERPDETAPLRSHKLLAAGPNGSGGVSTELMSVEQIFSLLSASDIKPFADPLTKREAKTANYSVTADDNGKIIAFTVTGRTLTLPLASAVLAAADGFMLVVSSQVGTLTIARSGSDTIVGATSITMTQGETAFIFLDAAGTGWRAAITPPYGTVARLDVANAFTQRQHWAKGTNIASAASIALPTNGNFFDVTGTATVTAISTVTQAGTRILLRATGAWTLQHNATSMILPGATNIPLSAGDIVELVSLGSGYYALANMSRSIVDLSNVGLRKTSIALSGAAVDLTSIASDAKRATLNFKLAVSAAAQPTVRIGPAAGVVSTGYDVNTWQSNSTGGTYTDGFRLGTGDYNGPFIGKVSMERVGTSNQFIADISCKSAGGICRGNGEVTLSAALSVLRLTTVAGTATLSGTADLTIEA